MHIFKNQRAPIMDEIPVYYVFLEGVRALSKLFSTDVFVRVQCPLPVFTYIIRSIE